MLREYFCAGTTPRYWRLSALLMVLYLVAIWAMTTNARVATGRA